MKVVESIGELAPGRRVVALGTFDGVHLGHRGLIELACESARRHGVRSTVATFDPMPLEVLRPEAAPRRLSGIGRRAALVSELGPDELLVVRFDQRLASLSPERFVAEVLAEGLGAVEVVVGDDYRFGHHASGNVELLRRLGEHHGFAVVAAPLVTAEGERVSSSWIRELFAKGEVMHAARLLGRDPWLDGVVTRGRGRGRELGVPTANLGWPPGRVRPAIGIYAGRAVLAPGERAVAAAISVGRNPTFEQDGEVSVEAHLLDFAGDVYGCPMRLEFRRFLRHELRFETVDDLVGQMWRDIAEVRAVLAG